MPARGDCPRSEASHSGDATSRDMSIVGGYIYRQTGTTRPEETMTSLITSEAGLSFRLGEALATDFEAGLAETVRAYDMSAAEYSSRFADSSLSDYLDRFVAELPASSSPISVLDAGCGHGRDCVALEAKGVLPVGLDLSSGLLEQASRTTNAPLLKGDMRNLPLASSTFAGIWACASLVHLDSVGLAAALAEFARLLRPDGVLFVSTREGLGAEWRNDRAGLRRRFYLYQEQQLEAVMEAQGFAMLSINTEPGLVHGRWINALARLV